MVIKYFIGIFFIATAFIITNLPGCKGEPKQENQKSISENKSGNNIIREGVIDIVSIDADKDGKVFQCPMDANVIDDKQNSCPTCGMDLEEVSLEKAKENLVKNDYKLK